MRLHRVFMGCVTLLAFGCLVGCGSERVVAERHPSWAQPVVTEHLENCFQVDERLFRSAQPDDDALADFQTLGIKRVLNLRNHHDDDHLRVDGVDVSRVHMAAGSITQEEVTRALKHIISADTPVIVHCWHGSDRTGTVVAAYRVVVQGWDKEAAVDELIDGGFGYHSIYRNIPKLIRSLDVEQMRQELGLNQS